MYSHNICRLIEELTGSQNGLHATAITGVNLYRNDEPSPRQPLIYRAGLVMICQGAKIGHFKGQELHYNADNYLVMAAPMPLECEGFGSKDKPLLVLTIDIDIALLKQIWVQLDQDTLTRGARLADTANVAEAIPQTLAIQEVLERLLSYLKQGDAARILGKNIVSELYYHALKGEQATALFGLVNSNSQLSRIASALSYIQHNLSEKMTVDILAKTSGMSAPTFHRAFKKVAGESPIQFIKKARLSRAKEMIDTQSMKANVAAHLVGYESTSQFNREFKRLFNMTPSQSNRRQKDVRPN